MLQFSCSIRVSGLERGPLEEMHRLCMMHMSLTNDLYSYEKERQEAEEDKTRTLNGVQVPSDLLDVPSNAAKNVLRQIILELERQLHQAYAAQARSGKLCDRQLR